MRNTFNSALMLWNLYRALPGCSEAITPPGLTRSSQQKCWADARFSLDHAHNKKEGFVARPISVGESIPCRHKTCPELVEGFRA